MLDAACAELDVQLVSENAFLGRGGFGMVFHVTQNDIHYALKIVLNSEVKTEISTMFVTEVQTLEHLIDNPNVVSIIEGSVRQIMNEEGSHVAGFVYLMKEVGAKCDKDTIGAANCLRALHELFRSKTYHGDARYKNLIVYNNQLLWIDFMQHVYLFNDNRCYWENDILKLVNSLYSDCNIEVLKESNVLKEYLDSMTKGEDANTMDGIIEFCEQKFSVK